MTTEGLTAGHRASTGRRMPGGVRVAFTIPNFITAGSGWVLFNIASRLDRSRFEPTIIVSKSGGHLQKSCEACAIPVISAPFTVPARPYATLLGRARGAGRTLADHRFRIWHSFHWAGDYTEPLIARAAGASRFVYTKKSMSWGTRAWKLKSLLSSAIVADNTAMIRQYFRSPLLRRKVSLVPHSIDPDVFRPGVPERHHLRHRLGIPDHAFLLGTVAQLLPVKGHPTTLSAIAGLPKVHYVLAGRADDAAYAAQLEQQIADLGIGDRVHLIGHVDEVPALLGELDAFVLPSLAKFRMEGCPVALLEAMACGVPSIASEIPGAEDIIEHGESGFLFEPENHAELRSILERLVSSPELRRKIAEGGLRRIREHYVVDREVRDHERLYARLLGQMFSSESQ